MTRTARTALLALLLAAIGITVFLHKVIGSNIPLLPAQTLQSWYIEAEISVQADRPQAGRSTIYPDEIRVQLPLSSDRFTLFEEDFEQTGFTRRLLPSADSANRQVAFTQEANGNGAGVIFYRAIIDEQQSIEQGGVAAVSAIGRQLVEQRFSRFDNQQTDVQDNLQENLPEEAILELIAEARQAGDDRLRFARALYRLTLQNSDLRVQAIQETLGNNLSAAELTAFLLQRAQVDARVGNGLLLTQEEAYSSDFIRWFEVRDDSSWLAYDPVADSFGPQSRYLTWWYGRTPPVVVQGSGDAELSVLVRPNTDRGFNRSLWRDRAQANPLVNYSLLQLPLATQRVFQVLVLIPIGALIVSLLHQIVGIKTFGTFTPVLIALSFREIGLWAGIAAFIVIVALGLAVRAQFNALQLLVVPRLSAILTTTVLLMIGLAILLDSLQIQLGLSLSLFPIVILAMTIEKAAIMWEEEGTSEVAIASLGSVFIAVISYFCMTNATVQYLAFTFPELLLLVLAGNLLVGRYNGYKLSEYLRFRAMQQQLSQSGG